MPTADAHRISPTPLGAHLTSVRSLAAALEREADYGEKFGVDTAHELREGVRLVREYVERVQGLSRA